MNVPPHWVMYIGATGLEDAVSTIERLGGTSLSPVIDVPTVGRIRTMHDPQGAMFSIYEPFSPPPRPEADPEIGDVAWRELYTTDAAAAMKFYAGVFGWPCHRIDRHGAAGHLPHVRPRGHASAA